MKDEETNKTNSKKNENGPLDTGETMDKTMVDIDANQFKKQISDKAQVNNPQTPESKDASKKGSLLGGLKDLFKK
ncbi:MAG: hypothetical protein A3G32_05415 [Deltaproteobacteria bacterium RIFCSPLOWO2_12_FULL_40_28]|nr:MAG: hypothetical protein A3C45_09525 [Deltaproteobacteria bacterium RIFCSPHIGHO2_02_FULL_40_28]OGQ18772.1 MAG: hypothetical protein A3E27_00250 [Deltaproteobacteria bacterium RIFCSPHIGHO2_12_FULL_40_32]OGQ41069.1 MAG: hypothetical protein A3I69_04135 [Deltaproteobacteria bacterium RIFCSPLOWO2_02_FULL_40_36]OGQ54185.1 MAG: hypothetical protein A3G32_05415 [Deltaproteobacteria bacterium RIFCSPLOWO2_12_FULL_40_28]